MTIQFFSVNNDLIKKMAVNLPNPNPNLNLNQTPAQPIVIKASTEPVHHVSKMMLPIFILVLLAGLVLGCVLAVKFTNSSVGNKNSVGQELTGVLFSQITGSVSGSVVQVDDKSFTIKNGDTSMKIYKSPQTFFFEAPAPSESTQSASLKHKEIQPGDFVNGTVIVNKDALMGKSETFFIGQTFIVGQSL